MEIKITIKIRNGIKSKIQIRIRRAL